MIVRHAVFGLAGLALVTATAQAGVERKVHFDLPAQRLHQALNAYAQQSGLRIVFYTEVAEGMVSPALVGDLTPEQALRILLKDSELSYEFVDDRTVSIFGNARSAAEDRSSLQRIHLAQTDAAAAPAASSDAAHTANASAGESLEEVVITAFRGQTATKTDTALVRTPQAISIITADELENRGAVGLQEGLRYSAGVRTEPNGSDLRFDYFMARGFSATGYIDGLMRTDNYYAVRTEVFTLERVEVLRGPSSVLYGQGTAGGIVNSITKRPNAQAGGEVGLEFGSHDRKQLRFDLTGPLTDSGVVSGRLVGVYRDADNQFDHGRDDRLAIAPSLRIQPGERTDIVISGLYQKDNAAAVWPYVPITASLLAPRGARLPDDVFLGEPGLNRYDREERYVQLLLQHQFNDWLTYGGGVRFNHATADEAGIYPDIWNGFENPFLDEQRRLLPRYRYDMRARTNGLVSDNRLQAKFTTGDFQHSVLLGVDYSRIELQSASAYEEAAAPIDIYAPVYGNIVAAQMSPYFKQDADQLGFYIQDQIQYRDRVSLVIGARRDRASTAVEDEPAQVDRETTFRAGLSVEVIDNVTPYVSYSESFQPTIGLDFYNRPFKPQRGIQYEAGVKWQLDPHTLFTVAGFDLAGTNMPQTDPENGQNTIQKGEVKSRGVELEIIRRLSDDYSVSLALSHLKMDISRSADPLERGLPISGVPRDEASAWADKTFQFDPQWSFSVGLGVRYVGPSEEAVVAEGVVSRQETPGFTLADAMLAVDWKQSTITLNVTNLFDRRYYALCSVRTACGIGYRRNVIGQWTYRF